MTDRMFGTKGIVVLALCACACGGSSPGSAGAAGSAPDVVRGQGGDGSATTGSAGSKGLPSAGSSGASAGSGGSGAGHSAGAGNSGSSCPPIDFCGGDLVGDWTVKQVCLEIVATTVELCGFATVSHTQLTASGTASFKADRTVASSVGYSYRQSVLIPPPCTAGTSEARCRAYATALSAGADVATDAQCNYDVAGCSCSWTNTESRTISGTYEVMQVGSVWITTSPVTNQVDDYCVTGNTLTLKHREGDTSVTTILTK